MTKQGEPWAYAVMQCVCLSRSYFLSKRISIFSIFFHHRVATPFYYFRTKQHGNIPTGNPNGVVECRWGRQKSRFWAYIWLHCLLLRLQQARCCQHGRRWITATVSQVECDTSMVVSGGVDCGRRQRNVHNKKRLQHVLFPFAMWQHCCYVHRWEGRHSLALNISQTATDTARVTIEGE